MLCIQDNTKVNLYFSLRLADTGEVIDSNFGRHPACMVVGDGNLPPAFESLLIGLKPGSKVKKVLSPANAFGVKNPSNVHKVGRDQFSKIQDLKVGLVISFSDIAEKELPGIVIDVGEKFVTIDFNHPLAGSSIEFEAEVVSVIKNG